METDGPLKLLFRRYPEDLLSLTGDANASVLSAGPVELQALNRRVDCVLQLAKAGETYYRHIEFQAEVDNEMAARVFRYNTQLVLEYGAAVLSTVIYLFPPKPKRMPVFQVTLGGRVVNCWMFEELCLGDLDAHEAADDGEPGLVALVPLMRGGEEWNVLENAARRIERAFPGIRLSDAEDVLLMLAGRHYTVGDLTRLVGRDRMIQSSLYTEGRAEGRAEGEARGRLEAERELCAAFAAKHHPAVFEHVRLQIEACEDPARLKEWALAASDLNDSEFLKLLGA
jgi:predicted transposase YdaD